MGAIAKYQETCEGCGIGECGLRNIWGYICVRCRACALSHFVQRLNHEQKEDGYWSTGGQSWEHYAVDRALAMPMVLPVSAGTMVDGSLEEQQQTTLQICRFFDQLIAELQDANRACDGYSEALRTRSVAIHFLQ